MVQSVRSRKSWRSPARAARGTSPGLAPLLLLSLLAIPPAWGQDPPALPPVAPDATIQTAANDTASQPAPPAPAAAQADPFAQDYLRLCAGCHTLGGGALTGPDLLPSTKWPRADLRDAVKRMEKNVGPMTDEQLDGLTDFLQKPDVNALLAAAAERRIEEMAATLEPGQPALGRQLFFGTHSFANGGIGCFACHAAGGRGGNMAKDLTMVHQRLGAQSLLSATEKPAFPMMVAAYGAKPLTAQEAVHVAAFLEETAAATSPELAAQPQAESVGLAHAGAGGVFLVVLTGVALLARRRRAGVRARMVRDSHRR